MCSCCFRMCLQICPSALLCWSSRCRYEPFRRCWPTPKRRLRGWVWRHTHTHQGRGDEWMYSRVFSDQGFHLPDERGGGGWHRNRESESAYWSVHSWLKSSTLFLTVCQSSEKELLSCTECFNYSYRFKCDPVSSVILPNRKTASNSNSTFIRLIQFITSQHFYIRAISGMIFAGVVFVFTRHVAGTYM